MFSVRRVYRVHQVYFCYVAAFKLVFSPKPTFSQSLLMFHTAFTFLWGAPPPGGGGGGEGGTVT
jgi:hypothetical protein